MTTRTLSSSARALAVACLVALVAAGCATTVPRADSTPPTVSMTVGGLGPTFTVTTTNVNRSTPAGPKVVMLAVAADPEGVKVVSISGAMTVSCSSGELGQAVSVHYIANNPDPTATGPGDEASDRRLTSLEIDTAALSNFCGQGFTFSGASGGFQARGENFHGGVVTTGVFGLTVN